MNFFPRLKFSVILSWVACFSSANALTSDVEIANLVESMIQVEIAIITNLESSEKQLHVAYQKAAKAASDRSLNTVLARTAAAQAEVLLALKKYQLTTPDLRRAVLSKAAELQYAISDLQAAEVEGLNELIAARKEALALLIKQIKGSKAQHEELLKYLRDKSLARKVNDLDVSFIGLAYGEAVNVEAALSGKAKPNEEELTKRREAVEDSLKGIQRLLTAVKENQKP
jgi:hypothetical protein